MSGVLIALIVVSALLLTSIFVIFNLLNKVEKYEETNETLVKKMEMMVESSTRLFYFIAQSKEHINRIDDRGIFQSNDEVGLFFEYLKEIQNSLNSLIENASEKNQEQQK